ncbi:MAG: VWA domain-containing protein [Halobacteriaceae archaeon]
MTPMALPDPATVLPALAGPPLGVVGPVDVGGLQVGLQRGFVLVALPVVAVAMLSFLRGAGGASRRERAALAASRLLIVTCLLVAAAGPFTVAATTTPDDPTVAVLEDRSQSTGIYPNVADALIEDIEAAGVSVERSVVGSGNTSAPGDGVVANLRDNGSLLLVSDGQVTDGRSLDVATRVANRLNATVNSVTLEPNRTDLAVNVTGPSTTSVDVPNRFTVTVDGVTVETPIASVELRVDGEVINETSVTGDRTRVVVEHNFSEIGVHRVTARLDVDDHHDVNDVYRKTVRVVPKPRVLYVADGSYRLERYLRQLYNVKHVSAVPDDLSGFHAVVTQNVSHGEAGNLTALQRYVLDGNGLVMVGGGSAFDAGGYENTRLEQLAPVRVGNATGRSGRILLAVDISASGYEEMDFKKALALNALSQLSGENQVGVLAFDDDAYRIADIAPLTPTHRQTLRERISSLDLGFGTDIPGGMRAANAMMGDRPGTVVLFSDGQGDADDDEVLRRVLRRSSYRVVAVQVGNTSGESLMPLIADLTGGMKLEASQANRLDIVLDPEENSGSAARALTLLDSSHFVTRGATFDARLPKANDVVVKRGASYLVAAGSKPAFAAWRYGVGRVVSITAYGRRGGLDGLLAKPDSNTVTRSVNWAIGDPRRRSATLARVPDTRVGALTTVTYRGEERPTNTSLSFALAGTDRYEATFRPRTPGYHTLLGATYAVNYPEEYARIGRSPELGELVRETGGRRFGPAQGAAIAEAVVQQVRQVRHVRTDWTWLALLAGLVALAAEIGVRRARRLTGRGTLP